MLTNGNYPQGQYITLKKVLKRFPPGAYPRREESVIQDHLSHFEAHVRSNRIACEARVPAYLTSHCTSIFAPNKSMFL